MNFETDFVKKSYEQIATHFDKTRYKPWNSVKTFIESLESGSNLLDVGCGNGKNMVIRSDLNIYGIDNCEKFIEICHNKSLNVILSDIRTIPFNDNTFDNVICIAVLHHLTRNNRHICLNEQIRVLKSGGRLMLQVWAKEQDLNSQFVQIDNMEENDYFVTWNTGLDKIKRYYHLYSSNEIDYLVNNINGVKITNKYFEKNNWVVIIQKL